jgi:uncharacterized protein
MTAEFRFESEEDFGKATGYLKRERVDPMSKEEIIATIQAHRDVLEEFSVQSLSVFGSVVRGDDRPDSDVDILVEFEPDARIGFFTFSRLQRRLSALLGRPVDLVTQDALHKGMKKHILEEAVHAA